MHSSGTNNLNSALPVTPNHQSCLFVHTFHSWGPILKSSMPMVRVGRIRPLHVSMPNGNEETPASVLHCPPVPAEITLCPGSLCRER